MTSLPRHNLEPDLLFGMSDQAMFWFDVLPWYQEELELLEGRHQQDGRFHVRKAVAWTHAFARKPKGRKGHAGSTFAFLFGETVRVKPAGNKNLLFQCPKN